MKKIHVVCSEAFSNQVKKGNPAGIVFDADGLSDDEIQFIRNIIQPILY